MICLAPPVVAHVRISSACRELANSSPSNAAYATPNGRKAMCVRRIRVGARKEESKVGDNPYLAISEYGFLFVECPGQLNKELPILQGMAFPGGTTGESSKTANPAPRHN